MFRKTTDFSSFVSAVSLYTYMQETLLSPHLGNFSCNDCAMLLHRSANFPAIISARVIDLLITRRVGRDNKRPAARKRRASSISFFFSFCCLRNEAQMSLTLLSLLNSQKIVRSHLERDTRTTPSLGDSGRFSEADNVGIRR